ADAAQVQTCKLGQRRTYAAMRQYGRHGSGGIRSPLMDGATLSVQLDPRLHGSVYRRGTLRLLQSSQPNSGALQVQRNRRDLASRIDSELARQPALPDRGGDR